MDDIAEVKKKTDIIGIIGEHVQLKKAGKHYKGLCPFHAERSASFTVSPELQIYKCFGCGESGDVFTFLEKYEGMEFYEALTFLAGRANYTLTKKSTVRSNKEELFSINELAAKFYHYVLVKHPLGKEALNYLTNERRLTLSTIETFCIGYSPETSSVFQQFFLKKKNIKKDDLIRSGIVYEKGNLIVDRFRGRVVFPLTDHRGNVRGFSGRILPKDNGRDLAKYINTPETPIYSKSELLFGLSITKKDIKKLKQAVVMEGELDVISAWQVGLKNVVAIKGSALTSEQATILSRFCSKVVLALDSDFAGDAAARRGITILERLGFDVLVATFGEYKDPDEAARADSSALFGYIDNARGVWDFVIDSVFKRLDGTDGAAKSHISREIVPVLSSIQDAIVRAHYTNSVALRLGVSPEAVAKEVEKQEERGEASSSQSTNSKVEQSPDIKTQDNTSWEDRILALSLAHKPKSISTLFKDKIIVDEVLTRIFAEYTGEDISSYIAKLPPELIGRAQDLVLTDLPDKTFELEKELTDLIKRIKRIRLNEKSDLILEKMRRIESRTGDTDDEMHTLQEEFSKVAFEIRELEVEK
jgi:DNA primase